jgi:segregation and condensation protein A
MEQQTEQISYKLESFEGPLDLLLSLLAKNKLNIFDINLTLLCEQYIKHIEAMKQSNMDIASEFLEMAARLVYMKTVSLLPKHEEIEQLKEELAGELLEYEVCRQIAGKLGTMTEGFNYYVRKPEEIEVETRYQLVHGSNMLLDAYLSAVGRGQRKQPPSTTVFTKIVAKKVVAVSTKIVHVMRRLWKGNKTKLTSIFKEAKDRSELVATFLAVLELCKSNRVKIDGDGEEMTVTLNKERNSGEHK